MEFVRAVDVEQNACPVMKSITRSALRHNITQQEYYDCINNLNKSRDDTQDVLR